MSDIHERVVIEFQQRRRRMLHNFGFALVLFALALILVQVADFYPDLLGIGRGGWKAAAMAQLIAGIVFAVAGFLQYRCPACNEIVRGHDKYYFGVVIDPDKCPHCGARFKE